MTTPVYLTTPIYYVNSWPTIGHAYTTIAADALARYQRLFGHDVFLLTGTDEHGVNIERAAAQRGLSPRQHVDEVAAAFRTLWQTLDISYDRFIRTTEPAHQRAALAFWERLRASGDLYRGTYEGDYCARCEAYYQPEELTPDGACLVHGLACERVREENWFFRLSRYQEPLERLVRDTPFVQPAERRREVLGVLRQGLRDFSVTRQRVRWGIPVPDAPDEVLYVWVDALANYLSGVGYPDDAATFARYWPADTHLVGKEIIRFHCLYWPALLLSAGLPLPRRVFAHGWLTKDGRKISKSAGNTVDPTALAAELGSDAVRHYLQGAVPFGQDGNYTHAAFVGRYNADLARDFGNLVQRVTKPAAQHGLAPLAEAAVGEPEARLRAQADDLVACVRRAVDTLALHEAVAAVGAFVTAANRYAEATAPWKLATAGDTVRLRGVLAHLVEAARLAAWYAWPVIPRGAAEAHRRLVGHAPRVGEGAFGSAWPSCATVEVGAPLYPSVRPAG